MNTEIKIPLDLWEDIRRTYFSKRATLLNDLEEANKTVLNIKTEIQKVESILGLSQGDKEVITFINDNKRQLVFLDTNEYQLNWKWRTKLEYVYKLRGALTTKGYAEELVLLDSEFNERGIDKIKLATSGALSEYVEKGQWKRVLDAGRNSTYAPIETIRATEVAQ